MAKNFDGSRKLSSFYRANREFRILLNGSGYLSRGIEKTQKNFDRRGLCQEVSICY